MFTITNRIAFRAPFQVMAAAVMNALNSVHCLLAVTGLAALQQVGSASVITETMSRR